MGIELFSDLPTSLFWLLYFDLNSCLSQNIKEMKPAFQEYVLSNSCYIDEFA